MIYTLAQNGTGNNFPSLEKHAKIITGKGSALGDEKVLKDRATRKTISQILNLEMMRIADKNEDFKKKKTFWNTYHCQNKLTTADGRFYGKYCKNRCCNTCCSIRKAEIINKYLPTINQWEDPYFVTLTVKTCKHYNLKLMISKVFKAFNLINAKYRKRNQRGDELRLMGIKSLECNFNPLKNTYNPHLHLIVHSKEIAYALVDEWLALWPKKYAGSGAQKIIKIDNLEKGLIEVIKYGIKIFTEPDVYHKSKNRKDSKMYVRAHYNIYEAMKGFRIFDRFGFNLPKSNKVVYGSKVVKEYYEWEFRREHHDWLSTENELVLTGFVPNGELLNLLEKNIDRELE